MCLCKADPIRSRLALIDWLVGFTSSSDELFLLVGQRPRHSDIPAARNMVRALMAEIGVVEHCVGAATPYGGVAAERSPLRDAAVPGVRGGAIIVCDPSASTGALQA